MFLFKHRGYYYVEFFDKNEEKVKRLSTKTKVKSEALDYIKELKTKAKELKRIKVITLSIFVEEYENFVKTSISPVYLESVQLSFRQLMKYAGDTKLKNISSRDFENFVNFTFSRSKYAALLYYRTIKASLSKAVDWGCIKDNPAKKVRIPKNPKKLLAILTEEELNNIITAAEKKHLKQIFIFAAYTGMRLNEILNLKWKYVELTTKIIKVANHKEFTTKSKKERTIPMNDRVLDILEELNKDKKGEFVFSRLVGIKFNADYISKQFKKSVRSIGLGDEIHFYCLRHYFASRLVQEGVSLYVVKELLGHEDLKTTQIYSHLIN